MNSISVVLFAAMTIGGAVAFIAATNRHAQAEGAVPIFVTKIPAGYRDWKVVSVAHEAGNLNDIRAFSGMT